MSCGEGFVVPEIKGEYPRRLAHPDHCGMRTIRFVVGRSPEILSSLDLVRKDGFTRCLTYPGFEPDVRNSFDLFIQADLSRPIV